MGNEAEGIVRYCTELLNLSLVEESTDFSQYRLQSERLGAIAALTMLAMLEMDGLAGLAASRFQLPAEAQAGPYEMLEHHMWAC